MLSWMRLIERPYLTRSLVLLFTLVQLLQVVSDIFPPHAFLVLHLGLMLPMAFLGRYVLVRKVHPHPLIRLVNWLLACLALLVSLWLTVVALHASSSTAGHRVDLVAGMVLLLLLLIAGRFVLGPLLSIFALCALLLALLVATVLPPQLNIRGFSPVELVQMLVLSPGGIYGESLAVAAAPVFACILLGTAMHGSGGMKFFVDLVLRLMVSHRQQVVQAAVLASAIVGAGSGSAAANALATGRITIRLMIRAGLYPKQAAAIQTAASVGGQLIPPVLGAGAFLIVRFTEISYPRVMLAAWLPAILYFTLLLIFSGRIHAPRIAIPAKLQSITPGRFFLQGWRHWSSLLLVSVLLGGGMRPTWAVLIGVAAVFTLNTFSARHRVRWQSWWLVLQGATRLMLPTSITCGLSGVVVRILAATGVAPLLSQALAYLGGESVLVIYLLVLITSFALGTGLPATSCYIVLAAVAVPTFQQLGVSLLGAHLAIFWLAQSANLSPPIAAAARAAASLSGTAPLSVSLQALGRASPIFFIPLLFLAF